MLIRKLGGGPGETMYTRQAFFISRFASSQYRKICETAGNGDPGTFSTPRGVIEIRVLQPGIAAVRWIPGAGGYRPRFN